MTELLYRRVVRLTGQLRQARARIKVLRDDNQRLWESREEWKRKHREREAEVVSLRRANRHLRESRDMWRSRARKPTRPRKERHPNVFLSHNEILRIMRMPARD